MDIIESQRTKLGDLVTIKLNDPEADFWIVRRGGEDQVGQPVNEFDKERFGITVTRTDILDAKYLFYMMTHLWQQGVWKAVAVGTTRLVSIKSSYLFNIPLG